MPITRWTADALRSLAEALPDTPDHSALVSALTSAADQIHTLHLDVRALRVGRRYTFDAGFSAAQSCGGDDGCRDALYDAWIRGTP